MNIELAKATLEDAETLWKMQVEAFTDLLNRYQDYDTNPASEQVNRTIERLSMPETYYYFIKYNGEISGAIRIVDLKDNATSKRISPIFIVPEFRGKGIAQQAIKIAEEIHGSENWELSTIMQEKGNCYLYEIMGYKLSGKTQIINDKMTLVFYEK